MTVCRICGGELFYYPAVNEDGWKCSGCEDRPGEPKGFSPLLDRALIRTKIRGLLMDLHERRLIYVSNGSHGESIEANVAEQCRQRGRFDQGTIVLLLVQQWAEHHAEYWQAIADGVLAGRDPRNRCAGGRLATVYSGLRGKFCTNAGCACGWAESKEIPF